MTVLSLFEEYVNHRNFGWGEVDVLVLIRTSLEALPRNAQAEIVNMIDVYEANDDDTAEKMALTLDTDDIHALLPPEMIDSRLDVVTGADNLNDHLLNDEMSPLCPHCGTRSTRNDILCVRCGCLIVSNLKAFKTARLQETASQKSGEYFDMNSQLVLHLRHVSRRLYVRPQEHIGELVMGRSDEDNQPDIDLATLKSLNHGVSRRHLAIGYDDGHHVVTVSDLNSVNGSFINGQRLFPKEVRILRDNDELRLGKLLVGVYFERQYARK